MRARNKKRSWSLAQSSILLLWSITFVVIGALGAGWRWGVQNYFDARMDLASHEIRSLCGQSVQIKQIKSVCNGLQREVNVLQSDCKVHGSSLKNASDRSAQLLTLINSNKKLHMQCYKEGSLQEKDWALHRRDTFKLSGSMGDVLQLLDAVRTKQIGIRCPTITIKRQKSDEDQFMVDGEFDFVGIKDEAKT